MNKRLFGEIPGFSEGSLFETREMLSVAGVHRPRQAGISGGESEGADSIVLSGGYVDDQDFGDVIIYTGHGGRDPITSRQVSDQLLTRGNKALAINSVRGLPVRVIRGNGHRSHFSPKFGYSYDGLFRVESYWREIGRDGFTIWRFRLEKIKSDPYSNILRDSGNEYHVVARVETTVQRIIRDTAQSRAIKRLYDFHCQICGIKLIGSAGPYAEAAHIRPLGMPHEGRDVSDNILCLCPNHHVLLDYGGFAIADDLRLMGAIGHLDVMQGHNIDLASIRYHRYHFYRSI